MIPGPNQPQDFNSFLVPFVNESLALAHGVETYNALTGRHFILREHPVIVSGDMQVIKHLEEMKGPNAKVPCRGCESIGVYHALKHTYYIPLAQPLRSDNPAASTSTYDPLNLPLRTKQSLIEQLDRMERAQTQSKRDKLATKFGIAGRSTLDCIPSIQRPTSYPHEFLHLFLLNHLPELVSLWTNTLPGISDSGCENYLISAPDWAAIGRETEAATNFLPSAFIRPLPNIQTSRHLFCGESWSFWLIYIGPIVLRGCLAKKYYDHFLELVSIVKCVLELSNTIDHIKQLREEIAGYVQHFEAPMWVSWSFSIERYCREVTACAKSKVVPYATINKHVLQMAQLAAVASRFAEIRKALLFGKANALVDVSRMECIYPGYPHTILRCPRLRGFLLKDTVRRRLAAYFHTNNPQHTFHEWLGFIPARCERWGKFMGSATAHLCDIHILRIRMRNVATYLLNWSLLPATDGCYMQYRCMRPLQRLDFILALVLPSDPDFNVNEPQLHILAHLTEAKGADGDAATELVSYTQLGRSFVLDVTAVENVVGRVETRGIKASGEWIIVDRSNTLCRTVFHQEEAEFEGDED
ncbi:hypothetical protein FRC06_008227 [Ceratobasidium sp. 370]|nr:hypothetical protein FRC06_008227 [Ceratobasidium sp. 370]